MICSHKYSDSKQIVLNWIVYIYNKCLKNIFLASLKTKTKTKNSFLIFLEKVLYHNFELKCLTKNSFLIFFRKSSLYHNFELKCLK